MAKLVRIPSLIGIILAFATYGYVTSPPDSSWLDILKIEWAIYHGIIGINIALNLLAFKWRSNVLPQSKASTAGHCLIFFVLQLYAIGISYGLYHAFAGIDLGETRGTLFYGDSGFAGLLVLRWSALWTGIFFVIFLIFISSKRPTTID